MRCKRVPRRHHAERHQTGQRQTSIGLLDKHADPSDRRAVTLTLTARELDLRRTYVEEYHAHLGDVLAETTAVPVPQPQLIRHASGRIRVPEI